MKTENLLTLPDGRKLAYAEFGKPDGYPVLYCHGIPSSRLEPLLFGDGVLSQFGLRLIAPDRPGMGGSDFQTDRSFSDWPEDVGFLVETLGLDRFSVLGVSGLKVREGATRSKKRQRRALVPLLLAALASVGE